MQTDKLFAKQYLLNNCIVEALELKTEKFGEGLNYLLQDQTLLEKFCNGFIDKHPDAPSQIDLKDGDVELLRKYREEFP